MYAGGTFIGVLSGVPGSGSGVPGTRGESLPELSALGLAGAPLASQLKTLSSRIGCGRPTEVVRASGSGPGQDCVRARAGIARAACTKVFLILRSSSLDNP
jgi:hypothetical protein